MKTFFVLFGLAVAGGGSAAAWMEPYPRTVPLPRDCPEPRYARMEVAARDGLKLTVHEWAPPQLVAGKPVVLLIHGIGFHGEPYGSVAAGFTCRGITLAALDLRGHGRSQGELAELQVIRSDIGAALELMSRRHPNAPVYLAGESMGGLVAADYARRGEKRLAGLVLLAPAFGVHPSRVQPAAGVAGFLKNGRIALDTPENLAATTRDEQFVKAKRADPLALHAVRPLYLAWIARQQLEWPRAAGEIKCPLYIAIAGQDKVVDNKVSGMVYAGAGVPNGQKKRWKEWREAYHSLCWDPATPQVVADVVEWMLQPSQ
jgi:alpha-beta hydrolase superfamily lysophospholipase